MVQPNHLQGKKKGGKKHKKYVLHHKLPRAELRARKALEKKVKRALARVQKEKEKAQGSLAVKTEAVQSKVNFPFRHDNEGTIEFTAPIEQIEKGVPVAALKTIGSLMWEVALLRKKFPDGDDCLAVAVQCNPGAQSAAWSCKFFHDITLFAQNGEHSKNAKMYREATDLKKSNNTTRKLKFRNWDEVSGPDSVFVKDGQLQVKVFIRVLQSEGVVRHRFYSFENPLDNVTDVTLIMKNGEKLHASKVYIGMHSPVLHDLFFSSPDAKNEFSLADVSADHMTELLLVIYPQHKKVCAENVEMLLGLATRFDISFVLELCIDYLKIVKEDTMKKEDVLRLADLFRLHEVQDYIIGGLKSMESITQGIMKMPHYKNFNDNTKVGILEKLSEISPP